MLARSDFAKSTYTHFWILCDFDSLSFSIDQGRKLNPTCSITMVERGLLGFQHCV
jgi:hypothetical protein